MGAGTERLENHLMAMFPDVPTIRIDRDSTQNKNAMQTLLQPVHEGDPCIIVGTYLVAIQQLIWRQKNLIFPHAHYNATLAIIPQISVKYCKIHALQKRITY